MNNQGEQSEKKGEQTPEELAAEIEKFLVSIIFSNVIRGEGEPFQAVILTQQISSGVTTESACLPIAIRGDCVEIEADGYSLCIKITSIKKARVYEL